MDQLVSEVATVHYESPGTKEIRTEPTIWRIQSYIIVDTKDAGDSVKISIDQQLLRMLGYELSIHHSRDDCEDLRGIQSQFLRSITQLL